MVPKSKELLFLKEVDCFCEIECIFVPPKPPRVINMEDNKKLRTMTEAEKERWQLIGVIATAIGTAIASFFAGKK